MGTSWVIAESLPDSGVGTGGGGGNADAFDCASRCSTVAAFASPVDIGGTSVTAVSIATFSGSRV